jgi:hypothetical protein
VLFGCISSFLNDSFSDNIPSIRFVPFSCIDPAMVWVDDAVVDVCIMIKKIQ